MIIYLAAVVVYVALWVIAETDPYTRGPNDAR